jgi:hypothetical protein
MMTTHIHHLFVQYRAANDNRDSVGGRVGHRSDAEFPRVSMIVSRQGLGETGPMISSLVASTPHSVEEEHRREVAALRDVSVAPNPESKIYLTASIEKGASVGAIHCNN